MRMKYITLIVIDCLWLFSFFYAYIRGGEVHGFFFLFMFGIWYVFNLFCALFLEERLNCKEEYEKDTLNIERPLLKRILKITIPKVKYLVIGIVNVLVIGLIIRSYINHESFESLALILLFIFDLFNLYLIARTKNVKAKEFYRILLIVCPLIIFSVWMLIA